MAVLLNRTCINIYIYIYIIYSDNIIVDMYDCEDFELLEQQHGSNIILPKARDEINTY